MHLRKLQPDDRQGLITLLQRIDNFLPEERAVALELIDESIAGGGIDKDGYRCIVAAEYHGEKEFLTGYICFGHTPMTEATYDLYWVAVDPDARNKGVGAVLVNAMEDFMKRNDGRTIRIETSSMDTYKGTVRFYLKAGFTEVGRIPDFYKPGDDLVIYYKNIRSTDRV